ncbi:hypothetical protein GCM10010310_78900 [Streptomyces violaceolatus]|uniref:Uncharacterized protein n=1 Tax=Streptomyces violaceolatus TaxID=67378 RepID=A0ABN3TI36_9ACTN
MYRLDAVDGVARAEVFRQFLAQLAQHDDRHASTFGSDSEDRIPARRAGRHEVIHPAPRGM